MLELFKRVGKVRPRISLTNGVDLTGFDPLETRLIVVHVVRWARKGSPNGAVLSMQDKLGSKYSKKMTKEEGIRNTEFRRGTLAIEEPFLIKPSLFAQ
jgi:hypothetical protein